MSWKCQLAQAETCKDLFILIGLQELPMTGMIPEACVRVLMTLNDILSCYIINITRYKLAYHDLSSCFTMIHY